MDRRKFTGIVGGRTASRLPIGCRSPAGSQRTQGPGVIEEKKSCWHVRGGLAFYRATTLAREQSTTAYWGAGDVTYVVTENCIKCKYTDCVEIRPLDCFYEGEAMLVINPEECIHCGVCEPRCSARAIKPEPASGVDEWLRLNAEMARQWPNIFVRSKTRTEARQFDRLPRKFQLYFSPRPAVGR